MRRVLATFVAAGAVVLPGGTASAAEPLPTGAVVASTTKVTPIDAGNGIATFSLFDATSRRYRLAISDGSSVRFVAAPRRVSAFDASVGTDERGRRVVTYTQCKQAALGTNGTAYGPYWPRQSGCRVRSVDVATGVIKTVSVQEIKGQTVWLPVQSGRSIAYARLRDHGVRRVTVPDGVGGTYRDRIHRFRFELVRQDGARRTHVLRGGPVANAPISKANGQDLGIYGAGVTSLDFDGRRVAYSWEYGLNHCESEHGNENPYATAVFLENGNQQTKLARACETGAGFLSSVDLQGDTVSWLHRTPGTSTNPSTPFAGTGSAASPASESPIAAPSPASVVASSVDGPTRWYVISDGKQVSITRATSGP